MTTEYDEGTVGGRAIGRRSVALDTLDDIARDEARRGKRRGEPFRGEPTS